MCSLVYVNRDSDGGVCEGSLPTIEVASRSRRVGQDTQPFSEWSLVQYYTGEINCFNNVCFSFLTSFLISLSRLRAERMADCLVKGLGLGVV